MSIETNSVPPWKVALLEKKRRQEGDRRRHDTDGDRLQQMPAWKREILMKKQQQKNSHVYLSKPVSPDRYSDDREAGKNRSSRTTNDVPNISVEGEKEEEVHILPITKNPLVKNDPHFKAAKPSRHSWMGASGSNHSHSSPSSHSSSWAGDTDGPAAPDRQISATEDEVFSTEQEVTYGRGFVHKLLQRFSHLSSKEDSDVNAGSFAGRRSSSTENILEGRLSPGYLNGQSLLSPNKARSTDNLLSPSHAHTPLSQQNSSNSEHANSSVHEYTSNSSHVSEDEVDLHNASIVSNESVVEELPKPNTVRTARSVFEGKNNTTSDSALAKPKLPTKPAPPIPNTPPPQQNDVGGGRYYNDTLSRKAGVQARDENGRSEDITDNTPQSPTIKTAEPVYASSHPDDPVKPQAAAKPASSNSWHYSGSKDNTSTSSEPPKRSFYYPLKPAPVSPVSNKEPALLNGIIAKPPAPVNGPANGHNGDSQSIDNSDRVLNIENNVHESSTDTTPVINNKQYSSSSNNRNETTQQQQRNKPDHHRLNLNLQLDTNGSSSTRTESNVNNDPVQSLNLRNKLKKPKRPAPTGPGSMLIRPASNLVTGTKTEYLKLTSYTDVKEGEFAPAKRRLDIDDEDVPVTNIDDVLDDIPVTDIDNIGRADANDNLVKKTKYDFIGENVSTGKNLLIKTRHGQRNKLTFEGQTTTYEYPSEQLLMDSMSPEPGDLDFNRGIYRQRSHDSVSSDDGSDIEIPHVPEPSHVLSSNTHGVGQSAGSLSSYRSKVGMEYELGQRAEETTPAPVQSKAEPAPEDVSITPADEDTTWSDVKSSDLLF